MDSWKTEEPHRKINFLKGVLVLSIVIVLNLFFNYAIKLIYDAPVYEDFCPKRQVAIQPETQEECIAKGGAWQEDRTYQVSPDGTSAPYNPATWCDLDFTCRQGFEAANSLYNRNVFIVLVILGIVSIIVGFFIGARSETVSLGLSFGGVLSLVIGSIRYWSDMDDYLRVIVLAVALGVLIWLGIKKIKN